MKMALCTTLAGFAAVGAVVSAAPANAESGTIYGGCHTDAIGRCMYMTPDQVAAKNSPVDMAAWRGTPDHHFAYWVTHDAAAAWFVIMDFDTVKAQGLRACQLRTNGVDSLEVVYDLQRSGGYTFDQAVNITSSAAAVYCPWVVKDAPAAVPTV